MYDLIFHSQLFVWLLLQSHQIRTVTCECLKSTNPANSDIDKHLLWLTSHEYQFECLS